MESKQKAIVLCLTAFILGCLVSLSGCATSLESKTRLFNHDYEAATGFMINRKGVDQLIPLGYCGGSF